MARGSTPRGAPPAVLRFAPSPNGHLHLGHAYSALLNAEVAARAGGRLLLRLEDIDPARCRPDYERGILEDLAWLGIPCEVPPSRQSEHLPAHAAALGALRARGLVYPCFCSRGAVARAAGPDPARDPDGAPLYPGTCRSLDPARAAERVAAGLPHAWRLDGARARAAVPAPLAVARFAPDTFARTTAPARPERWGDAVLARRDVPTSYHLAVVLDDAAQAVTHVVRGADLAAASDLHALLQALFGLPHPLYHHHRLILDPEGRKLAKSAGSESLRDLRARGATADDVRARLGFAAAPGSAGSI